MPEAPCPCGSGQSYAQCCGPAHRGERLPQTAENLMRSRYCAYVRGDVAYLRASWDPRKCPAQLDLAQQPLWQRLEIIACSQGQADDDEGTVEFKAFHDGGCLHERSRFRREQGRWLYVDGTQPGSAAAKTGRNQPCPCGSGRKFKQCCGR